MSITRALLLLFAPVCLLFCSRNCAAQQANSSISLQDGKLTFTPHQFYILNVVDERNQRTNVLELIGKDTHPATEKIDLKDGAAFSIKNFITHNLQRDTSLHPVVVAINEFKLSESSLPDGRVNGHLIIAFSFALQQSYKNVHLVDYNGGIRYTRPGNQSANTELFLRQGIEGALTYFNTWIDQQADNNVLLATAVKVNLTDYKDKAEGDTIYYADSRPLTWGDFQDKPRNDRFEAEVFTSIGYTEQVEVVKGIIHINMAIKVGTAKSDCWVKDGARTDYALNHEQRHFDIEKLVSEHFKQRIRRMTLPVDNFDGPINMEYLETLREANRLQKQYDTETRHGEDKQAQERWNDKIDTELKALGLGRETN
jgi:hypothetical protein